jgi:general stress protein 26
VDVPNFESLADEFRERVNRIAWCTFATVAGDGAPRTRILHPIWEGPVGWVATTRRSLKTRHLEHESRVALTYWDPAHDVVHVQAVASWADDQPTRDHVWDLLASTPSPAGYDPGLFWKGRTDPVYGALRLEPFRIEVTGLASSPKPKLVWRR